MMNTKKQGPIRSSIVVPFFIIAFVISLLHILFFDKVLKSSLEYILTRINGAEVNIAQVNTSIRQLSLNIKDMQFTDTKQPHQNLFTLGDIDFSMTWDALLRGKIMIEESAIRNIRAQTPRSKPGHVIPPKEKDSTQLKKKTKKVFKEGSEHAQGNVFGDLAALLSGKDQKDITKAITADLKAQNTIKETSEKISQQEEKLKVSLGNLPTQKSISDLESRASSINLSDLKNLRKAKSTLKEIRSVKKEIDNMINSFSTGIKQVNESVKILDDSQKTIDQHLKEDIKALSQRVSVPGLDQESIAKILFGKELTDKLATFRGYQQKIQHYIPQKDEEDQKAPTKQRADGINYEFPTKNSYPLFWLKYAKINSKNEQGTVSGSLKDLTSNQYITNSPTILEYKADFPPLEIRNMNFNLTIDRRHTPITKMQLYIDQYPVKDKVLTKSSDATMIVKQATGGVDARLTYQKRQLNLEISNTLRDTTYSVDASSKILKQTLNSVADNTPEVTMQATAKGRLLSPRWSISTNLAGAISSAVSQVVQQRYQEQKQKVIDQYRQEVELHKKRVNDKIAAFKEQHQSKIKDQQKRLREIRNRL